MYFGYQISEICIAGVRIHGGLASLPVGLAGHEQRAALASGAGFVEAQREADLRRAGVLQARDRVPFEGPRQRDVVQVHSSFLRSGSWACIRHSPKLQKFRVLRAGGRASVARSHTGHGCSRPPAHAGPACGNASGAAAE